MTINGIAKGAGMIAPDMATMLSFVFTDAADRAARAAKPAQGGRGRHVQCGDRRRRHFHLRHAARVRDRRSRRPRRAKIASAADPRLPAFRKAFDAVLANLAEQVARDGEGARKLVEIIVEGAVSKTSARKIALSIANSPLVKTAIAGEDANWGRVVMAVGKAGEPADRDRLSIWFGGIRVAHKGERDPGYDEAAVSAAMKKPEITLKVALGIGRGARPRAHLRSHQGVRRDQRRLSVVMRLLTFMVTVVALLTAGLAPASAQGAREGKVRIIGRATIEAVPDYVTVQGRHLEPSPVANRRARPELGGRPQDHRFFKEFRRTERDIQTSSVNLAPNYKTVRDAERDHATGTGQPQREQHGPRQVRQLSRLGAFMRQILDQGATNIAGVHFGLTNLENRAGRDEGGRGCGPAGAGPCASRQGEARTDPGHCISTPYYRFNRNGWRARHAAPRRGKNRRSHRGRDHQDHRRGRNHLGHRVMREPARMCQQNEARAEPDAHTAAPCHSSFDLRSQVVSVKLLTVAACALVDTDGRVLLARRPAGKPMAGLWEFPGGKVEAGERPEQTLIRELKEELGIVVNEACLAPLTFASHGYPDFHLLMPLYICRRWEGTATALEGQQLAWVRVNRLRDYPMPPADEPLVAHLMTLL